MDDVSSSFSHLPYRRGVGIMLVNAENRVFAGERLDIRGAWQMPQGGIDEGENPIDAVYREMEEEIGTRKAEIIAETPDWLTYDLPRESVGKFWKGRYRGQAQKWFALRFTGSDADINIQTEHPEFIAWRWMTPVELNAQIVPFKRDLYAAVYRELAPHVPFR